MENILKREMYGKYIEKRNVWKIYRKEKCMYGKYIENIRYNVNLIDYHMNKHSLLYLTKKHILDKIIQVFIY